MSKKQVQIQNFKNVGTPTLGYADINDPYDQPFIMKDLLTPEQCKQIIDYCRNRLVDSEVVGGKFKNIRNSQQCWIPKTHYLVKPLFKKLSQHFRVPFENAEDLQVVRYLPGQYYNEHHDSCCDDNDACRKFLGRGGHRVLTVLAYLSNDFIEGNTYFPKLGMKVKPPVGSALVFYPLAKNKDQCHPKALHGGQSLRGGEKWVCNIWFRQNEFK